MRIKFIYILLVFGLVFTTTSCKGNNNDLNKQVEKLEDIISESKLFSNDYKLEGNIKEIFNNKENITTYTFLKDSNKYYLKFTNNNQELEYWVNKDNDRYYLYFHNNKIKEYNIYSDENKMYENIDLNINTNLMNIYNNIKTQTVKLIEKCDSDSNFSCHIDKLFSKLTFVIDYENEKGKSQTSYTFKKGKIYQSNSSFVYQDYSLINELKFNYKNQSITIPSDYKYVN